MGLAEDIKRDIDLIAISSPADLDFYVKSFGAQAGGTVDEKKANLFDAICRQHGVTASNPYRTAPLGGQYSAQPPASPPKPRTYTKDDLIAQARRFGGTYVETHLRKSFWTVEAKSHDNVHALFDNTVSEEGLQSIRHRAYAWFEQVDRLSPYAKPARAGINNAARMPCARKPDNHGFHPVNEKCPYCP